MGEGLHRPMSPVHRIRLRQGSEIEAAAFDEAIVTTNDSEARIPR